MVPETVKASWAAQAGQPVKTGPARWNAAVVLFTKQQATPAVLQRESSKPLMHLEVTPEDG